MLRRAEVRDVNREQRRPKLHDLSTAPPSSRPIRDETYRERHSGKARSRGRVLPQIVGAG